VPSWSFAILSGVVNSLPTKRNIKTGLFRKGRNVDSESLAFLRNDNCGRRFLVFNSSLIFPHTFPGVSIFKPTLNLVDLGHQERQQSNLKEKLYGRDYERGRDLTVKSQSKRGDQFPVSDGASESAELPRRSRRHCVLESAPTAKGHSDLNPRTTEPKPLAPPTNPLYLDCHTYNEQCSTDG
jgi:hypothetical protein